MRLHKTIIFLALFQSISLFSMILSEESDEKLKSLDVNIQKMIMSDCEHGANEVEMIKYISIVPECFENYKNPSEDLLLEYVKIDPRYIRDHNVSDAVKMEAFKHDHSLIEYFDNPSEEMQLLAIKSDYYNFRKISKPANNVILQFIKYYPAYIQEINATREMQLVALKTSPSSMDYIKDLDEEMQFILLNYHVNYLSEIEHLSKKVQMKIVKDNVMDIYAIKNPDLDVQLYVMQKDPGLFHIIKNPSHETKAVAIKADPYNINLMTDPSEDLQFLAVKENYHVLTYIENPTPKVKKYAYKFHDLNYADKVSTLPIYTLALEGDAQAQYYIGMAYLEQKEYKDAFEWFLKSAEQGNAYAQFELSIRYVQGEGTFKSNKKYVEYTKKSVAHFSTDSVAYHNMGVIYENGIGGCKIDFKKAAKWYLLAANGDCAPAQYNLALLYMNGRGVEKNMTKAKHWFTKAADQDHINAMVHLGQLYIREGDFTNSMKYYKQAAALGDAEGIFNIGVFYQEGKFVEEDLDYAKEMYEKSADKGFLGAKYALGTLLYHQDNFTEAKKWFEAALNDDSLDINNYRTNAAIYLAGMYEYSNGVQKDMKKAEALYLSVPESILAQKNLAILYKETNEYAKCVAIYEKLHREGDTEATMYLALLYEDGKGVKQDMKKAEELLLSLKQSTEIRKMLAHLYIKMQRVDKCIDIYLQLDKEGDADAAKTLKIIYEEGLLSGAPKNDALIQWYIHNREK